MPKNVMKLLKPSPNHGRNDFDLSHRQIHTANYGELIPNLCLETVPGDKFTVRISDLVRAQPMVTSPFVRAKQHVDVWFVPYNLMWSRFNEFLVDKDEPGSSALKDRLYVPHVQFSDIVAALQNYTSNFDIHGNYALDSVLRNLELLGYPGTLLRRAGSSGGPAYPSLSCNLWRLLAYNLIWYREYRQQYYDNGKFALPAALGSLANSEAYLFNLDVLPCDTIANANPATYFNVVTYLTCLMQQRYRCWKKDIFTGLLPDTQFGNVSTVDASILNPVYINNTKTGVSTPAFISADLAAKDSSNTIIPGSNAWNLKNGFAPYGPLTSNFDILALRKSQAVQLWRENSLRAGNQVQDNFEAHFGEKPRSHMDVHPEHVASFDAPLNVGDINATAQIGSGDNQYLGDVAGKGIISFDGNQKFSFEAHDYGVLMGIYSILPEAEYNANNLDRMNALLEREDYFFPEYENLGLEAVAKSTITCNMATNGILGYAPRYYGYKQKHDRCVGQFQSYTGYSGMFRQWCAPKYDVDDSVPGSNILPLSCLYVNPSINGINFVDTDPDETAQFIVDFYADVEAFRKMSVSGMPGY